MWWGGVVVVCRICHWRRGCALTWVGMWVVVVVVGVCLGGDCIGIFVFGSSVVRLRTSCVVVLWRVFRSRVVVWRSFSLTDHGCSVGKVRHRTVWTMFRRIEFVLAGGGGGHCCLILCG